MYRSEVASYIQTKLQFIFNYECDIMYDTEKTLVLNRIYYIPQSTKAVKFVAKKENQNEQTFLQYQLYGTVVCENPTNNKGIHVGYLLEVSKLRPYQGVSFELEETLNGNQCSIGCHITTKKIPINVGDQSRIDDVDINYKLNY